MITKQIKLSKSSAPGKVSISANGATVYFACESYPAPCESGEEGASFLMSGGTSVSWSAPSSGAYNGVSVFFDRESTGTFGLTGSSNNSFSGTLCAKSALLSMTGPSGVSNQLRSRVVVGEVKKTGDSAIVIDHVAALNPPTAASGGRRLLD